VKSVRFAITGLGLVTPLGNNAETNWRRLTDGESAVYYDKKNEAFLARVSGFDIEESQRQDAMAQAAILEAIDDAGLKNAENAALVLGGSKQNLFKLQSGARSQCGREVYLKALAGFPVPLTIAGSAVSAACATGILTVIKACSLIADGVCAAAVCGCSETSLHPLYIAAFKKMGVLSKNGHRPFDKDRDGFALGEGAGFVVVENYDKALERKAKIYCKIAGKACGMFTDNPVNINSSDKMSAIIGRALNGETPDFALMHATGTRLNDYYESQALKRQFAESRVKDNSAVPPASSTKAATGHLLSVSGIAGIAFSALAMKNGIIPPTLNFNETDIPFGLNYVAVKKRFLAAGSALTLSWGFGGQGAALYLKC
jgi:3-oxoacyl-[acyl-carrier-protein] synthase II